MSRLSADTRGAARRRMRFDRNLRDVALVAGLAVALSPGAPVAAAALGVIAIIGTRRADSAGDMTNDPPRSDYSLETKVEESEELWSLGDSEVEREISELLRMALITVAYEEAMVSADERALGAELAGADDYRAAREREADDFGATAADYNVSLKDHADKVAGLLESTGSDWQPGLAVAAALRAAGQASADFGRQYGLDHPGSVLA